MPWLQTQQMSWLQTAHHVAVGESQLIAVGESQHVAVAEPQRAAVAEPQHISAPHRGCLNTTTCAVATPEIMKIMEKSKRSPNGSPWARLG